MSRRTLAPKASVYTVPPERLVHVISQCRPWDSNPQALRSERKRYANSLQSGVPVGKDDGYSRMTAADPMVQRVAWWASPPYQSPTECAGWDSNPHALAGTCTSSMLVYLIPTPARVFMIKASHTRGKIFFKELQVYAEGFEPPLSSRQPGLQPGATNRIRVTYMVIRSLIPGAIRRAT